MSQISVQSILNNAPRRATASATVPHTRPSQGTSSSDANYGIITSSMPEFEEFPAQPSIGQDELFEKVCSLLKDEKVRQVGIYGMGGVVGKTSLLKKIHNEYLIYCDFDIIIRIPMPKEVDYKNLWKFLCTGEWLYRCFYLPNLAKEES